MHGLAYACNARCDFLMMRDFGKDYLGFGLKEINPKIAEINRLAQQRLEWNRYCTGMRG